MAWDKWFDCWIAEDFPHLRRAGENRASSKEADAWESALNVALVYARNKFATEPLFGDFDENWWRSFGPNDRPNSIRAYILRVAKTEFLDEQLGKLALVKSPRKRGTGRTSVPIALLGIDVERVRAEERAKDEGATNPDTNAWRDHFSSFEEQITVEMWLKERSFAEIAAEIRHLSSPIERPSRAAVPSSSADPAHVHYVLLNRLRNKPEGFAACAAALGRDTIRDPCEDFVESRSLLNQWILEENHFPPPRRIDEYSPREFATVTTFRVCAPLQGQPAPYRDIARELPHRTEDSIQQYWVRLKRTLKELLDDEGRLTEPRRLDGEQDRAGDTEKRKRALEHLLWLPPLFHPKERF